MLEIKDIIENYSPFSHMCIVLDMPCYSRVGCGVLVANPPGIDGGDFVKYFSELIQFFRRMNILYQSG